MRQQKSSKTAGPLTAPVAQSKIHPVTLHSVAEIVFTYVTLYHDVFIRFHLISFVCCGIAYPLCQCVCLCRQTDLISLAIENQNI